ncbi:PPPDE putative peptidase domain-containing protein [Plectosphaerella plurivora]|uniref:PPPDE putative peptidase domain-containing protein n=1 Tax=Plectosphaerella plurivora TaxID=936078 RepID=A0A9P8VJ49_9PEZI|nr:PPPDE putative peptidase domain-containing protein [Plectosphaerella plurivora]
MPPPADSRQSRSSHRSTLSLSKTEVTIHVYDLLPEGRLSSVLWAFGTSLLHSGVVINGREYAYGGHGRPNMTGVYWTKPKAEPPGGTFKMEILHGFTFASQPEIENILDEISQEFQGTLYNLLKKNCNHFTSELCRRLTGNPGPGWLNRAASIGVALPCVVPGDWISPPEYDTAEGQLLDDDEDEFDTHEGTRMLKQAPPRFHTDPEPPGREDDEWDSEDERRRGGSGKGKQAVRDEEGRQLPAAERAPRP